jgi:putative nucleotidyltransferase with HDIG domain
LAALTIRAKLFILAEVMAGLLVVAFAAAQWSWSGPGAFLLLLGLSVATGSMKVVLPRVQGSLSTSYVFLMWGIVRMSLAETLLIGWAAALFQSYWHCKTKPTAAQLLFNLSAISLSIGVGSLAFKAGFIQELIPNQLVRILLAATAYFVANTVSVSIVIGLTERLSVWNVWRASYLWSFPHYLLSASLVCAVEYLRKAIGLEVALLILPAAYLVYQTFGMHITTLNQALERTVQEKRHAEESANLHLRTIRALALAIEAKDRTTAEHLHRVQTYAMELAKDFGLPPEEMEALRSAAILHDVGKLVVPEQIISKPGRLTPDEFARMKTHAVVGAEIVASADFPFAVAPLVRAHHEKWDGSGYPDGLKGEEIPMGARILTAVDCLDALVSDRQYRKAMPREKAMSIIVSESGKSFDPRVVEALCKRSDELEKLAQSTMAQNLVTFSSDVKVDRGFAPDAGYAGGSQRAGPVCALGREEAAREVSILNFINSQIGQFESIEADVSAVEEQLHELIPFDCFALYRRRGQKLECVFAKGEAAPLLLGLSIEFGVGVSGWTVANRTPLSNGNAETEFGVLGKVQSRFTLSSSLSIPLESEFGPIGVLTLYSRQLDAFQTSHLRALLAIASRLAYQMNLDSSRPVRAMRDASLRAEAAIGIQLGQLSEVLQSDSALSRPFASHQV